MENVRKLCRVCMKHTIDSVNIFQTKFENSETVLVAFLRQITNLEITEDDGLGDILCSVCYKSLLIAFELVQQSISTYNNLKKNHFIQESDSSNTQLDPHVPVKYFCEKCHTELGNDINDHVCTIKNGMIADDCIFKCKECPKTFSKKLHLNVHSRSHVKDVDKKFTCNVCKKNFIFEYLLKKHQFKHSEEKPYPCQVCDKGCLTAESLKRHLKIHDKDYTRKQHFCNICMKEFPYRSFLAEHMKNHTGEKPHLCSICGKGFRQSGALHYHQKIHTGYKPFKCNICDQNFIAQSVLNSHMRKHTNERPFICHICGMAFRQSTILKSHQRTHTGYKPILCTICGKRMSTTGQLTIHVRSHTGEKPFSCQWCSKAFTTKQILVKHERIHTGERPFLCNTCGKTFRQSNSLKNHQNTHLVPKQCKERNLEANVSETLYATETDMFKNALVNLESAIVTEQYIIIK